MTTVYDYVKVKPDGSSIISTLKMVLYRGWEDREIIHKAAEEIRRENMAFIWQAHYEHQQEVAIPIILWGIDKLFPQPA